MKTKTEPFDVLIPTPDGNDIAERVTIEVVHEWDEEIGEWLLAPESLQKIDDTKARRMGLLLPAELRAIRERLGLTQSQIAEQLKIGEKSWSRWESGRHRPSQSMNLLVRALDAGRLDAVFLRGVPKKTSEWSFLSTCRGHRNTGTNVPRIPGYQYDRYAPNYGANDATVLDQRKELAAA